MNGVIGDILPLAVGIAISPIPVIATILILLSPRARASSLAFLAGWTAGIAVAVTVFSLLGSAQPDGDTSSRPVTGMIQLALGALLALLAARQWRSRPGPGDEPALPGWMSAMDTMGPGKAAGLAFLLASVNPKNLLLAAGAGVAVSALGTGAAAVTIVVFTLVAALTVAVPVVAFLCAGGRSAQPLDRLRVWLVHNNATIMSVVLIVLAAHLIGKGIASF